jgi:hypothetical protein
MSLEELNRVMFCFVGDGVLPRRGVIESLLATYKQDTSCPRISLVIDEWTNNYQAPIIYSSK